VSRAIAFETYVGHVLAPSLRRGDIVLLENLTPHQHAVVRQLIEKRGARVESRSLPPYSPDLNPFEQCCFNVKTALRAAKARILHSLVDALADALRSVTAADIAAGFARCSYAVNP
jgi:transposase